MQHTKSSTLFRQQIMAIPGHRIHVYGRMITTMYLFGRYGDSVRKHSIRLAKALERMDGTV